MHKLYSKCLGCGFIHNEILNSMNACNNCGYSKGYKKVELNMPKTIPITFRVDPETLDFLEQEAKDKGMERATNITNLIRNIKKAVENKTIDPLLDLIQK